MGIKNNSRTDNLAADQNMIDGIQKNQAKLPASFPLEGQTMTPAGVVTVLQERIAAGKAVIATEATHAAAVKADKDKRTQTRGLTLAFKRLLLAMFAQQPDTLGEFGVKAPKPVVLTAAEKAAAADKGKATRKVLGTKGPLQKKAALAAADGAHVVPPTPPAPAPLPPVPPKPVS